MYWATGCHVQPVGTTTVDECTTPKCILDLVVTVVISLVSTGYLWYIQWFLLMTRTMIVKCIFIWTVVCSIQLASSSGATETKACDDHSNCMCNVVMLNCSSNNLQTEDLAKPFPKVHRDVYLNHNLLTALDDNHMR